MKKREGKIRDDVLMIILDGVIVLVGVIVRQPRFFVVGLFFIEDNPYKKLVNKKRM